MIKMCTIHPNPTLCQFEVSRRPVLARKMGYVQAVEHPKKKELPALDYKDTAAAKMEAERQPRRVKRLKINVNTK
jgi:hypothetical protein